MLFAPSSVSIVDSAGLRIVCQAHLCWPELGILCPVTLDSLIVMVRPSIESRPNGDALVFKVDVEGPDLVLESSAVDGRVVELLNKEIQAKHVEPSWNFAKTLGHIFPLPGFMETAASLGLHVAWGETRITSEAFVFAVSLYAKIGRRPEGGEPQVTGRSRAETSEATMAR
jgi:hypothetical protein